MMIQLTEAEYEELMRSKRESKQLKNELAAWLRGVKNFYSFDREKYAKIATITVIEQLEELLK